MSNRFLNLATGAHNFYSHQLYSNSFNQLLVPIPSKDLNPHFARMWLNLIQNIYCLNPPPPPPLHPFSYSTGPGDLCKYTRDCRCVCVQKFYTLKWKVFEVDKCG